jgi:hypothetical protein
LREEQQMDDAFGAAPDGPTGSAARGDGDVLQAARIIEELVAAARADAIALAEEQKSHGADQVADMAEAVRRVARCFDQSQVPYIGEWADQAAGQIEGFAQLLRTRRWDELLADAEAAARRQPALFILAAVAAGFVAGRLLAAPAAPSTEAAEEAASAGVVAEDAIADMAIAEAAARDASQQ